MAVREQPGRTTADRQCSRRSRSVRVELPLTQNCHELRLVDRGSTSQQRSSDVVVVSVKQLGVVLPVLDPERPGSASVDPPLDVSLYIRFDIARRDVDEGTPSRLRSRHLARQTSTEPERRQPVQRPGEFTCHDDPRTPSSPRSPHSGKTLRTASVPTKSSGGVGSVVACRLCRPRPSLQGVRFTGLDLARHGSARSPAQRQMGLHRPSDPLSAGPAQAVPPSSSARSRSERIPMPGRQAGGGVPSSAIVRSRRPLAVTVTVQVRAVEWRRTFVMLSMTMRYAASSTAGDQLRGHRGPTWGAATRTPESSVGAESASSHVRSSGSS
jgi:hypothetical protein